MSSGALVSICLVTDGSKTKIIQINANSSVADLFRKIRTEVNHARDASFTLIHHGRYNFDGRGRRRSEDNRFCRNSNTRHCQLLRKKFRRQHQRTHRCFKCIAINNAIEKKIRSKKRRRHITTAPRDISNRTV